MLALAFQTCNLSFKEFELNDSFLQEKKAYQAILHQPRSASH